MIFGKRFLIVFGLFTQYCLPKAIIWDLGGVLFKQEKFKMAYNEIGLSNFFWHAILDHKNPKNIKKRAFQALYNCGRQDKHQLIIKDPQGQELPLIMCQWLAGIKTPDEIMQEITETIKLLDKQDFFYSKREKKLIKKVINVIFDPSVLAAYTKPIEKGVELLKLCAKNPENELYILSNWDPTSFEKLYKNKDAQAVFQYFKPEHVYISGAIGFVKPQEEAFKFVLEKAGLNPSECMFIDDQIENCRSARLCGIPVIHLKNGDYDSAKRILIKKGFIHAHPSTTSGRA